MAAGEDQPVDQFGMLHIRFDKGDSHGAASAGNDRAFDLSAKACGLPNLTPTPKLNRYAESAVLNF
jgi:hypothetical protein